MLGYYQDFERGRKRKRTGEKQITQEQERLIRYFKLFTDFGNPARNRKYYSLPTAIFGCDRRVFLMMSVSS